MLPHVPGREVHHEAELGIIIGKTCAAFRAKTGARRCSAMPA
jgi:2-keto-4-pentenoate hydratase/2-oxohepta-3-ene-1,7-dioic acid hydratase in catechol pathway